MEKLHEAVLYSKDNCQWCDRVKQLMNACNFPFVEYKYGQDFTRKEFYAEFGEGATFPQVQIDNKHVGGCKDTLHYLQSQGII
jgi:glutaredoxin|tara:strand:- start:206 stop:454 length:249 start_codon:yes stop_codon:yes gene_type:complete